MRDGERERGRKGGRNCALVGFRLTKSPVAWYCRYWYEGQEGGTMWEVKRGRKGGGKRRMKEKRKEENKWERKRREDVEGKRTNTIT